MSHRKADDSLIPPLQSMIMAIRARALWKPNALQVIEQMVRLSCEHLADSRLDHRVGNGRGKVGALGNEDAVLGGGDQGRSLVEDEGEISGGIETLDLEAVDPGAGLGQRVSNGADSAEFWAST